MEGETLLRFFHPRHYSYALQRFKSEAIEASTDGLSVVDETCATGCNGSACGHFAATEPTYGARISGSPPVFARIPVADLPAGCRLELDDSNGDQCHYLIVGLSKKQLKKHFEPIYSQALEGFRICDGDGERPLTIADIEAQNPKLD